MPYDRNAIFEQAKKEAESKKLIWIEEVASFLPISLATFYVYFPVNSEELEAIKEIIANNRISLKAAMRKKWYDSENPTLQVSLMKLLGTEEETHRLNGSKTETKTEISSKDFDLSQVFRIKSKDE